MRPREYAKWQVPTLVLFALFFGLSTAYLKSAICIEGGTVIGYPLYFFTQCYSYMPGGPLDEAEFALVFLLVDVVFWYAVSVVVVLLGMLVYRRLRGM